MRKTDKQLLDALDHILEDGHGVEIWEEAGMVWVSGFEMVELDDGREWRMDEEPTGHNDIRSALVELLFS